MLCRSEVVAAAKLGQTTSESADAGANGHGTSTVSGGSAAAAAYAPMTHASNTTATARTILNTLTRFGRRARLRRAIVRP